MTFLYDVKTTEKVLNSNELVDRRIDVSGDIADYVYEYENSVAKLMKENGGYKNWDEITEKAGEKINDKLIASNTKIVDAMYDQETGIAALAVEDELTGETYISYAGTNIAQPLTWPLVEQIR